MVPFQFTGSQWKLTWDITTGDEFWLHQFTELQELRAYSTNLTRRPKRQSEVWLYPGDSPLVNIKRWRSIGRPMMKAEHFGTVRLLDKRAVSADRHSPTLLSAAGLRWRQCRQKMGRRLPLAARRQREYTHCRSNTMGYSWSFIHPNLQSFPLRDWWVFPHTKQQLQGTRFECTETAVEEFPRAIDTMCKTMWAAVYSEWFEQMSKYVAALRDFV